MELDLNLVIEAMLDQDNPSFYDRKTGEILYADECEDDDDDRYVALPDHADIDDYGNMEKFIDTVSDETAVSWLSNAIVGKGAFRRFRAACERFRLLNDWYDFEEKQHRLTAASWCLDNGIPFIAEGELPAMEEKEEDEEEEVALVTTAVKEAAPVPKSKVVRVTSRNSAALYGVLGEYLNGEDEEEELDFLLSSQRVILASSMQGRFTGFLVMKEAEDVYTVETLYVRKDSRRQGFGTQLLKQAEAFAEEEDREMIVALPAGNENGLKFLESTDYHTLETLLYGRKS